MLSEVVCHGGSNFLRCPYFYFYFQVYCYILVAVGWDLSPVFHYIGYISRVLESYFILFFNFWFLPVPSAMISEFSFESFDLFCISIFFRFLCNNIKMTLWTRSLDLSHNWRVPSHCNTCAINFFRISFIGCYWCMHFFYVRYVIDAMRIWNETQLTFSKTSKTSEYEFFPSFFFFF